MDLDDDLRAAIRARAILSPVQVATDPRRPRELAEAILRATVRSA
jgi:hypothetical protein